MSKENNIEFEYADLVRSYSLEFVEECQTSWPEMDGYYIYPVEVMPEGLLPIVIPEIVDVQMDEMLFTDVQLYIPEIPKPPIPVMSDEPVTLEVYDIIMDQRLAGDHVPDTPYQILLVDGLLGVLEILY